MQIVIDIPEKVVRAIQEGRDYRYDIHTAIAQGTPLPKIHGRLIDADALNISHGVFMPLIKENVIGCPMDAVFVDEIEDAQTIIEAYPESEEDE